MMILRKNSVKHEFFYSDFCKFAFPIKQKKRNESSYTARQSCLSYHQRKL